MARSGFLFLKSQRRRWGLIIMCMLILGLLNLMLARCVATPPRMGPGEAIKPELPAQPVTLTPPPK